MRTSIVYAVYPYACAAVLSGKHKLPKCYQEFKNICSKQEASVLAPLEERQHAIELVDRGEPLWGPIYSLLASELKVLREYLALSLEKG